MKVEYDKMVDAKGLKCPKPLLLTKLALKTMQKGEVLLLEATDEHTDLDLEVWCERFGHEMIHAQCCDNIYKFWIIKF